MTGAGVWLWGGAHAAVGDNARLAAGPGRGAGGAVAVTGQAGPTSHARVVVLLMGVVVVGMVLLAGALLAVVGGAPRGVGRGQWHVTLLRQVLVQDYVGQRIGQRAFVSERLLLTLLPGGGVLIPAVSVSGSHGEGGADGLWRASAVEGGDGVVPPREAAVAARGGSVGGLLRVAKQHVAAAAVAAHQPVRRPLPHPGRGSGGGCGGRGRGQDGHHVGGCKDAAVPSEWGGAAGGGGEG